jgi:hypothetical protein
MDDMRSSVKEQLLEVDHASLHPGLNNDEKLTI